MQRVMIGAMVLCGCLGPAAWAAAADDAPPCLYPGVVKVTQVNPARGTVILENTPVCVLRVVTDVATGGPEQNANCPGEPMLAVRSVVVGPAFGVDGTQADTEAIFCASQVRGTVIR